jgi:hypothetical protein
VSRITAKLLLAEAIKRREKLLAIEGNHVLFGGDEVQSAISIFKSPIKTPALRRGYERLN